MHDPIDFDAFFRTATDIEAPFGFQREFAEAQTLPSLVRLPTGSGKTAMAILGWLWRRRFADEPTRRVTPRRLVYCLPMRVLVEQTRDNAIAWLHRLGLLAGIAQFDDANDKRRVKSYVPSWEDESKIAVSVLMGGEQAHDWDLYPERDAIVIGTQDMLLSRALNRGYGMSRYRWPMHFGLLNNDCLWVMDEVQLMGSGLATTAQLAAFREAFGVCGRTQSVWMSATLEPEWLRTVDHPVAQDPLELKPKDLDASKDLRERHEAHKPLSCSSAQMGDLAALAQEIMAAHQLASRTLAVMNTVDRAKELCKQLEKQIKRENKRDAPKVVLIHSRFRPADRQLRIAEFLAEPPAEGTIIVSTQVVEAGMDVSARTLFTELAPWASLVQRFGRCNRRGEFSGDTAPHVVWIDLPDDSKKSGSIAAPYPLDELESSRSALAACDDVGLAKLPTMNLSYEPDHVVRRKDMVELFDTTPDLAGNDIDIDRFVRGAEETDVHVFWREIPEGEQPDPTSHGAQPARDEICRVPCSQFQKFVSKRVAYRWDPLDSKWIRAQKDQVFPGRMFLVPCREGGYDPMLGWTPPTKKSVPPQLAESTVAPESNDADELSRGRDWQTIVAHTDAVCAELENLLCDNPLDEPVAEALRTAARWHDRGKAHEVFRRAVPPDAPDPTQLWAKAKGAFRRYERPRFRHELASALAALDPASGIGEHLRGLVAYLAAAHHGKVRVSIRSLPEELWPDDEKRFARGVWDGDRLPPTPLGCRIVAPECVLSLEPMELGSGQAPPFEGQPSWIDRVFALRDRFGIFRLAMLETLLRVADMRASRIADAAMEGVENHA